jgi:hypothetical protein
VEPREITPLGEIKKKGVVVPRSPTANKGLTPFCSMESVEDFHGVVVPSPSKPEEVKYAPRPPSMVRRERGEEVPIPRFP